MLDVCHITEFVDSMPVYDVCTYALTTFKNYFGSGIISAVLLLWIVLGQFIGI